MPARLSGVAALQGADLAGFAAVHQSSVLPNVAGFSFHENVKTMIAKSIVGDLDRSFRRRLGMNPKTAVQAGTDSGHSERDRFESGESAEDDHVLVMRRGRSIAVMFL